MKLIFMGTPEFAVPSLARLLSDGHELIAVFTQPDKPVGRHRELHAPPVKTFALEHGIPVYQPAKLRNNEEVFALFTTLQADACVVAAYGKILPERLLHIPRLGCINVHASLLPKYRGAAPINWAIANGERETGVTIMQMDAGMDTGGMFAKRAIGIGEEETAAELTVRLSQIGAELLSETLPLLERGELRAAPQTDSEATYAPMLKREDGLIDWQKDATEIANQVRAFQPWPAAYTIFHGGRLIIWRAKATTGTEGSAAEPAQIVSIDKSSIMVACANHIGLQIMEVQPEGKRRMPARDFLNGTHLHIGDRLTDVEG